jgi:hypothetical protein
MKGTMKTIKILALIFASSLLLHSQSKAADLTFTNQGKPDLTGQYVDMNYQTNTSLFQAIGFSTFYTDKNTNGFSIYDEASYNYTLTAYITSAGLLTNGTISISGDPIGFAGGGPSGYGYDTNLLTGTLVTGASGVAFGYGDLGNQVFQFRFDVTGGILASAFGGIGAPGGIIFTAYFDSSDGDHPFTGIWTKNFDSNGSENGDIDTFAVPEPSPTLLMLVAGGVCAMMHRCRRNKSGARLG